MIISADHPVQILRTTVQDQASRVNRRQNGATRRVASFKKWPNLAQGSFDMARYFIKETVSWPYYLKSSCCNYFLKIKSFLSHPSIDDYIQ